MKTNLQYFADPNAEPNSASAAPNSASSAAGTGEDKKYTQDDLNRMMASKAKAADAAWQKKFDDLKKSLDSEKETLIEQGKKLAGETAQQELERKMKSQQENFQRAQDEFKEEKANFKKQKALTATTQLLAEKKLPTDFAPYFSDPDPDIRKNNVEKFAETFAKQTQAAVDERVKGTQTPQTGNTSFSTNMTQDDFNKLGISKRMQLASEDPELYKKFSK